jgi:hypothetical protein
MADQLAAHVTLIYPWEAPDASEMIRRLAVAAPSHQPFRLRIGDLCHGETPADGVWFEVDDIDGGLAAIRREVLVPPFTTGDIPPHVTIVHPRTSINGARAWRALAGLTLSSVFWVRSIGITAWDGQVWPTVATIPLASSSSS